MASIAADSPASSKIPAAAWFALVLMAAANLFNYLDRQIVSILAQSIKSDLKLDDADLGFILGTAFAVFYSVVGIAMGRISDFITRKKLMAFGVALWSVMTALGGAAGSFTTLAFARIGVGVGEAVANPCSNSLLADVFPKQNRAMALGANLSGTFLGGAAAMVLGGVFLQYWDSMCLALPWAGACSVKPWQAALYGVGLTGLPLSLLILLIREPARPQPEDLSIGQVVTREVGAALPPFTFLALRRLGGTPALLRNLVFTAIILVDCLAALPGHRRQGPVGGLRIRNLCSDHLGAGAIAARPPAVQPDLWRPDLCHGGWCDCADRLHRRRGGRMGRALCDAHV